MQEYFIGLDVHQRSWSVTILLGREKIFGGRISTAIAIAIAIGAGLLVTQ